MKTAKKLLFILCSSALMLGFAFSSFGAENNMTYPYECDHCFCSVSYKGTDVVYECADCNETISVSKQELIQMWDMRYFNELPDSRNASQYLDVNNDNFINAKDFAIIIH